MLSKMVVKVMVMSLATPEKIRSLQRKLYRKAKVEPEPMRPLRRLHGSFTHADPITSASSTAVIAPPPTITATAPGAAIVA
jgi:hypothetical protein